MTLKTLIAFHRHAAYTGNHHVSLIRREVTERREGRSISYNLEIQTRSDTFSYGINSLISNNSNSSKMIFQITGGKLLKNKQKIVTQLQLLGISI